MKVDDLYARISAILLKAAPKTHWAESCGNGGTVLDDERDQLLAEGMRGGTSKRRYPQRSTY